jgi:hypothetical protein
MESKFLNVARIKRLKELRSKLPSRCSFAQTISQNLAIQGVDVTVEHIYQMVRGHRTVNEKVLDEMQKLVSEFQQFETVA